MPEINVRLVRGEELYEISRQLMGYAFRPTPPLPDSQEWQKDLSRYDATYMVLFEDGKAVAGAASSPMTQNVRGHLYASGGVWGVAVHPSARRQGYAREVLKQLFVRMRSDGLVFSTLYAFRESFYDRLGYTTFPQSRVVRFASSSLYPLLKKELDGEVELVEIGEGLSVYQEYLKQQMHKIHGMGLFNKRPSLWPSEKKGYWLAIARVAGEVRGTMLYKIPGHGGDMEVQSFYYDNSQGKYLLLAWFARHIDHAREIEVRLRPDELPETWLPDMNVSIKELEPPLGRVIDVAKMGGMHSGPGSFTARISDPLCPWNEGSYLFESNEGRLEICPGEGEPECSLSIQALSALAFGTHDPETFAIRGWGDPAPKLQASMRSMFPPMLPYLHERF